MQASYKSDWGLLPAAKATDIILFEIGISIHWATFETLQICRNPFVLPKEFLKSLLESFRGLNKEFYSHPLGLKFYPEAISYVKNLLLDCSESSIFPLNSVVN